ncbi:hypothetical protein R6Q59_002643 [Mikania micrantha]
MSNLRFITISSLLLLAIASTLFTGFHCKGRKTVGFVAASNEEVRPKNVYIVAAAAAARDSTLRSPKTMADKTIILNNKVITSLVGRRKPTSFRRIILSGDKNEKFVAFTEDYHPPRHHPPKNN